MKIPRLGEPPVNDIWVGLFAHVDSVARATLELLLKLKGLGIEEHGKEYFVDETKFRTVDRMIPGRERRVGGNGGNAAYFLGKLGVKCNLSAPVRPEALMKFFYDLPVYFWGVRKKRAKSAGRDDPVPEHIVIELFPPLSNYRRTIISWDPMTMEGWLDEGFWARMKEGIFLLSGIHLIQKRGAVDEIIERLKKRRVRTYFELGEPTKALKHALNRLLEEGLVGHLGMNEREARKIFGAGPEDVKEVSREVSCGVTIHNPEYVTSTDGKMLRPLVDVVEAWAMGDLAYYKQVVTLPLKRSPKGTTPGRNLPFLGKVTGLGDAVAALDAVRVFDPRTMEELIRELPFHRSN